MVALSSRLAKLGVVVAQSPGCGWWSGGGAPGISDARDSREGRGGPRGFHDAIGIRGHLIEVSMGRACEDLANFGGELGQEECTEQSLWVGVEGADVPEEAGRLPVAEA